MCCLGKSEEESNIFYVLILCVRHLEKKFQVVWCGVCVTLKYVFFFFFFQSWWLYLGKGKDEQRFDVGLTHNSLGYLEG